MVWPKPKCVCALSHWLSLFLWQFLWSWLTPRTCLVPAGTCIVHSCFFWWAAFCFVFQTRFWTYWNILAETSLRCSWVLTLSWQFCGFAAVLKFAEDQKLYGRDSCSMTFREVNSLVYLRRPFRLVSKWWAAITYCLHSPLPRWRFIFVLAYRK